MKIISLDAWGGRMHDQLISFLNSHQDVDVFCFQEVLRGGSGQTSRGEVKNLYEDISKALASHTGYFSEYGDGGYYSQKAKDLDFKYGLACFVKKEFEQSFVEGVSLYDPERKWSDYDGRLAAGAALAVAVSDYAIINVHGLWQGSMKKDSEARFEQSKRIINLASKSEGKKIICGDFNLEPDTESIKMIENSPMRNLIKDYGVTSTRTSHYTKEGKFADYIFTDRDLKVPDFKVLADEVSDHSPLYLECQ